jgi:hypothetical protein
MQFKQWFDKRAEKGQYHTVTLVLEQNYNINTWEQKVLVSYEAVKYIKARPTDANKYGRMTQEEAIAMAKLLNTTIERESAK